MYQILNRQSIFFYLTDEKNYKSCLLKVIN